MPRLLLFVLSLLLFIPGGVTAADRQPPYNLLLFFSNDVHGKTEPCG